jgi:ABC-type transport system involved in multi-copper enzyme maturation permease subunit
MSMRERLRALGAARRFAADVLPLLGKELIELAAQPRTYLLRALFAAGLFALYAMRFHGALTSTASVSQLGSGRAMLDALVWALFVAIYLLVPAMVAPTVLAEREGGTLEVLLVSRLRPWQLLAQKLLSRTTAMGAFLLLALPLAGIAYSLGGIGVEDLVAAGLALALGALQVGVWSLYCGARARSGMGGVVRAYIVGVAALFVLVPLATVPLFLAAALTGIPLQGLDVYPFGVYAGAHPLWRLPIACVPTVGSIVVLFLMASRALEFEEAWWEPRSTTRPWRERKAMVERSRSGQVPDHSPVAWRERARIQRWLVGATAPLWGLAALVLFITVLIALSRLGERATESVGATVLVVAAHIVAIAAVAVQSATMMSEERARGTLEVLLTTPLEPREILEQKLAGPRLLGRLSLGAIAALCLAEAVLEIPLGVLRDLVYLPLSLGTAWIYLELAAWVGVSVGLRARTPAIAAMSSVGILLAWTIVPPVVVGYLVAPDSWLHGRLMLLGPAAMIGLDEAPPDELRSWLVDGGLNAAWYGLLILLLRAWCRNEAPRRLSASAA